MGDGREDWAWESESMGAGREDWAWETDAARFGILAYIRTVCFCYCVVLLLFLCLIVYSLLWF